MNITNINTNTNTNINFPSYTDLKGAKVFITGAGSGIGACFVEAFLAQGAKVAFVDIVDAGAFVEKMQEKFTEKPSFFQLDLKDAKSLISALPKVKKALGGIDVLVNNAANDARHSLEEFSAENWDESMHVNLRPHFLTIQYFSKIMKQQKSGVIINMGSNSHMLGLAGYSSYATAKAAVAGMSRIMARELGVYNIRVNCISPGWVMTEKQKRLWVKKELLQQAMDEQCLKTSIEPEDIADLCLFLASKASSKISGQNIVIDAGRFLSQ